MAGDGSRAAAAPGPPTPDQTLLRAIYQELVEINTTDSVGDNTAAARAMAARLKAGGFPDADMHVIVPPGAPKKGNLVARLKGTGTQEAAPPARAPRRRRGQARRLGARPFKLSRRTATSTAAGSIDDKAMAAIFVDNLIRYQQDGYKPDRDIILALTADEELGRPRMNGVMADQNHRDLIDADFALNEGGGGEMKRRQAPAPAPAGREKVPVNFRLEAKNTGGHSSVPRKDNAIYQLAEG